MSEQRPIQPANCIKGIECSVKNCAYHDGKKYCCADHINVGPSFAVSSNDTIRATFKRK